MRRGKLQHISQLQIGDVVRLTHGDIVKAYKRDSEADDIAQRLNGGLKQVVGGPSDYREGYDTMTVTQVLTDEVTFQRPYITLHLPQQESSAFQVNFETINSNRHHGGLWFELLSCGPRRKSQKHWEEGQEDWEQ